MAKVFRQVPNTSSLMCVEHIGITAEEAFGAQVRFAREARDWTQDVLARRVREVGGISIDQAAIARLERGKRAIRLNEATVLAQTLDLDLGQWGGTGSALTEESYRDALKELEQIRSLEVEASRALIHSRETVVIRERDVTTLQTRRLRLEESVREYEGQRDGQH